MIAETVAGVGGIIAPPAEYFSVLKETLAPFGTLLIADEVQTAWGRLGDGLFAMPSTYGTVPDIITSAKGLGSGVPISVVITRPEIADAFKGPHINTFGGNPLSSRAGLVTIETIARERLVDNARRQGETILAALHDLQRATPLIGDVRGRGLMIARGTRQGSRDQRAGGRGSDGRHRGDARARRTDRARRPLGFRATHPAAARFRRRRDGGDAGGVRGVRRRGIARAAVTAGAQDGGILEPVRWEGDAVAYVDQRRLPHDLVRERAESVEQVVEAIATLAVRGAPCIGMFAAYGVALARGLHADDDAFSRAADRIRAARPTAVNLAWAVDRMLRAQPAGALAEAHAIAEETRLVDAAIARHGAALVPADGAAITHCNTGPLATGAGGTALGVLIEAHRSGKRLHVYADETRHSCRARA